MHISKVYMMVYAISKQFWRGKGPKGVPISNILPLVITQVYTYMGANSSLLQRTFAYLFTFFLWRSENTYLLVCCRIIYRTTNTQPSGCSSHNIIIICHVLNDRYVRLCHNTHCYLSDNHTHSYTSVIFSSPFNVNKKNKSVMITIAIEETN